MVYVDTSVLVPLFLNEPHSAAAADWYAREKRELVAAAWCIPEFASALGIKQRTGTIDAQQAGGAWTRFERMVAGDLRLLPVEPAHFHRAAELVLDAASALRAGDALHLACAEAAGAKHMATFDDVLSRNAQRLKIQSVVLRLTP
jgi:predicted nucleic acid-binding protein